MSLSCSPHEWCGEEGWYYFPPEDYAPLATKRSRKCCSCHERIPVGVLSTKFLRERCPRNDVEERIYGHAGEVPLAPWFMCERCSDLYFSLDELGFAIWLSDDMRELVKEYAEYVAGRRKQEPRNA